MPMLGKHVLGLALSLAVGVAAAQTAAAEKLKIGFIYPSPVGEVGWAKELDKGRETVEAAFGDKVETVVVESVPEGPDAA
ncbi:MAG: BMP family ABC transporter substrate-binding protein, partial [Geminicoccaceae bacterium]